MEILDPDALLGEVVGQVLGHLLGQGGDQHPAALCHHRVDAQPQVVDLAGGGNDVHLGVDQSGGPDDLFDDVGAVLELPGTWGGRQQDDLAGALDELLESQGPVVHGRGQPEPVVDQGLLAGPVPGVLAPELGHGYVTFVHHHQVVLGEEVEQGERRLAGRPAVEVPAVVLDAAAHPRLGQHLEVVFGPHPQPLGLEQLARCRQFLQPDPELGLDGLDRLPQALVPGAVVGVGEHHQLVELVADLPGQHIEGTDPLHGVAEELDADRLALVGGMDLDGVPPGPELASGQGDVVARVLEFDQSPEQSPLLVDLPGAQGHDPVPVLVGRAQPVDAGHRGHHDGVGSQQQRGGAGVTEPVDLVVDRGVLLDIGVRGGHVRLGLVVVVVGDEVLDAVAGEELLQLGGQLGGQRLVGLDDQSRTLHRLDRPGHGGRLPRPGDPEQGLVTVPAAEALDQAGDGLGLVPRRPERRHHLEFGHGPMVPG